MPFSNIESDRFDPTFINNHESYAYMESALSLSTELGYSNRLVSLFSEEDFSICSQLFSNTTMHSNRNKARLSFDVSDSSYTISKPEVVSHEKPNINAEECEIPTVQFNDHDREYLSLNGLFIAQKKLVLTERINDDGSYSGPKPQLWDVALPYNPGNMWLPKSFNKSAAEQSDIASGYSRKLKGKGLSVVALIPPRRDILTLADEYLARFGRRIFDYRFSQNIMRSSTQAPGGMNVCVGSKTTSFDLISNEQTPDKRDNLLGAGVIILPYNHQALEVVIQAALMGNVG